MPNDVNRANQLNPHHADYWRSRGMTAQEAKMCASAGENIFERGTEGSGASLPARRSSTPRRSRSSSRGPPSSESRQSPREPSPGPCARSKTAITHASSRPGAAAHPNGVVQTHQLLLPGESDPRHVELSLNQKNKVAPMHLSLLVDTSGSMSGAAISNVMDQCTDVLKASMRISHTTKTSVYHFDTSVKQVIVNKPIKAIRFSDMKIAAENAAASGVTTAMYDAITSGVSNIKHYHETNRVSDTHYFLMTFTDGMDNSSKSTLDSVAKLLAHPGIPNFHFYIISAGLGSVEREQLDSLVSGKRNSKHIPAGSTSKSDLRKAFMEFTSQMEESLTMKITSKAGSQPAMDAVLKGLQQMQITQFSSGKPALCGVPGSSVSVAEVNDSSGGRGRSRSSSVNRRRGRSNSRSRC